MIFYLELEKELRKKNPDKNTLGTLSSQFYSHIPHDFRFMHMSNFIINSKEKLKEKLELVESLADIQIAAEIINEVEGDDDDANELDAKYFIISLYSYKKMKCEIVPMDGTEDEYDTLIEAISSTHGSTHSFNIEPIDVFKIKREGEAEKFKNLDNRMLLWHGSRFSNFGGILSQGLRIAPPEAPVSGYMFGKGVYFADMVSKSAQY